MRLERSGRWTGLMVRPRSQGGKTLMVLTKTRRSCQDDCDTVSIVGNDRHWAKCAVGARVTGWSVRCRYKICLRRTELRRQRAWAARWPSGDRVGARRGGEDAVVEMRVESS